jgi:hypothetical protein
VVETVRVLLFIIVVVDREPPRFEVMLLLEDVREFGTEMLVTDSLEIVALANTGLSVNE